MVLIDRLDLVAARADADGDMLDRCEIRAPDGDPVFDESTGKYTKTPGGVLYSGKCKRQAIIRFELTAESGAHQVVESRFILHLPMQLDTLDSSGFRLPTPRIPEGSRVTMTDCPLDPVNVGQRFYVAGPGGKTLTTAQRLNVTEVVG